MGQKINKKLAKNWKENDVFAIKIKSDNKEYDGRYFIIIRMSDPNIEWNWKYPIFRAKITKDDKLPKDKKEIEELNYIKTGVYHYIERNCYMIGDESYEMSVKRHAKYKYNPDEYGFLYHYHFTIFVKNKEYKDIIYLGNYDINKPLDESIIEDQFSRIMADSAYENISERLIKAIEFINKPESSLFNEGYEKYVEGVKQSVDVIASVCSKPLKQWENLNGELEEDEDDGSETYVGNGIDFDSLYSNKNK